MKNRTESSLVELYRQNRVMVWVCAVILVSELGFGAIVPAVPLFASSFGVSQSAIGLTLSVYGFARFLLNVPTGQLCDRIGRRWTLVLGEAVTVVGNLLCGLATSYEQFLFFRFLAGAGASIVITSSQTVVADISTRENRGRMMSVFNGVFNVGVGLGPLPGGLLAEHFGLGTPFFMLAGLSVLAIGVAFSTVPETRGMREGRDVASFQREESPGTPFFAQVRTIFSRVGFVLVSLVTLVQFYTRTGLVYAVIPVMVTVKMELTPDQIGAALGVVSLANVAMMYVAGALADRLGRKAVIVPSTLISAVAMVFFAVAPDFFWLMLASIFWGVVYGISAPPPLAYAADTAPPGMNAVTMSSFRTVADLGYVIGPVLAGWMADVFSSEMALYATGVLFLLTGVLFAAFAPETARARSKQVAPQTRAAS